MMYINFSIVVHVCISTFTFDTILYHRLKYRDLVHLLCQQGSNKIKTET